MYHPKESIDELKNKLIKSEALLKIWVDIYDKCTPKERRDIQLTKEKINTLKDEIKTIKYFIAHAEYGEIKDKINKILDNLFIKLINENFAKYECDSVWVEITDNGNMQFYWQDTCCGFSRKQRISLKQMEIRFNIPKDIIDEIKILLGKNQDSISGNGSISSPSYRFDILKRDNYRCQLCGKTAQNGVELEIDHKIPRSKGGSNHPDNLWVLCFDCNRGKSAKDL